MKRISATKIKQNFGKAILYMMQEKVIITKNNKDIGIFISTNEYKKLINTINDLIKTTTQNKQSG
jgi:PHD/YefM family antitoxin component YafN of YafNO toxin-antitoxin module